MITTSRETDYVLNRIEGPVTILELLDYAHLNIHVWFRDPVLWDLSNGTLKEDPSDYTAVQSAVGNIHWLVEKRKGCKTAFAAPDPYTYGMLRMAITIVECNESHPVASVFAHVEEAKVWLRQG